MAGVAIDRASSFAAMNRAGMVMPNPRGFDQPGQVEGHGRFNQNSQAENSQLEVTLINDDEDGIPDRGVVEVPVGPGFNRGFDGRFNDRGDPPQAFGRGFNPGQRQFSRIPFLPLAPLGGLFCLTILGGLTALGVVLYRRRSSPASSPVAPTEPVVSPVENDPPETELLDVETDEADTPEDIQPETEVPDEVVTGEDDNAEPDSLAG